MSTHSPFAIRHSSFIIAFVVYVLFGLCPAGFAAPAINSGVLIKSTDGGATGNIFQTLNFPTGKFPKFNGVTLGTNIIEWSNVDPTVTGLNLVQLGLPSPASYILIATDGTPSYQTAATIVSSALPISDSTFTIKGSGDATKLIRWEVDDNTTGTTRVYKGPNYNATFASLAGAEFLTGPKVVNGMRLKVATASGTTDAPTPAVIDVADPENSITHTKVDWGATAGGINFRTSGPTDLTLPTSGIVATVGGGGVKTTSDATVASASTLALGSADGIQYDITGTTTVNLITGIAEGEERILRFTGALTLTHGANLLLPRGQNILTAAGGQAFIIGKAAGVIQVQRYVPDGFSIHYGGDFYTGGYFIAGSTVSLGGPFSTQGTFETLASVSIGSTFTTTGPVLIDDNFSVQDDISLASDGTSTRTLNIAAGGTLGSNAFTSTSFLPLAGGTMTGQIIGRTGGTGAGTAPIKLVSGSLNTTPESGAIEFLADTYYLTQTTGPTRKSVVLGPSSGPITFTGPTAPRTVTFPDANFTAARTDAGNTWIGHQLHSPDNTYDIGAAGATRPRYGHFGTGIGVGIAGTPAAALELNSAGSSSVNSARFLVGGLASGNGTDFYLGKAASAYQAVAFGYNYSSTAANAYGYFTNYGDSATAGVSVTSGGHTGVGGQNDGSAILYVAGNTGIGVKNHGTSAVNVFGIGNGTEPTTSPADMIQFYSVDLSAGNATLGIRTETAVATESVTSDRTLSVRINGTTYKILLSTP